MRTSILISVVVFGHSVVWWQWVGVLCVFGGLSLSVQAKYAAKKGKVEAPKEAKAGTEEAGAKLGTSVSNGAVGGTKKEQ